MLTVPAHSQDGLYCQLRAGLCSTAYAWARQHGLCLDCRNALREGMLSAARALAVVAAAVQCWAAQLRRCELSCARPRRYVPGPVLRAGKNEVILLEVEHAPEDATGARPLSMHAPSPSMPACLRVSRKHKLTLSLPGPLHTCLTGESSVQAIYRHGEQAGTGASVWARV